MARCWRPGRLDEAAYRAQDGVGEWAGTMCLTEPGCGTDLRLMKTKAVEQPDGTYRMSGTKIFISGGDQDLTGNIIHMVIAKIPDETARSMTIWRR